MSPTGKRAPDEPPTYQVIAKDLLELIESGQLGPGDRLPTQQELALRYGVTRPTVRQAYELLVVSKKVAVLPRNGYFVRGVNERRWVLSRPGRYVDPWSEAAAASAAPSSLGVTVELVAPQLAVGGRALSEWFESDIPEVICRSVLRTLDGRPVQLAATFMPLLVADNTALRRPAPLRTPLYGPEQEVDAATFLAECCGERLMGVTDTTSSRLADARETRLLELPDASMVTEVVRQIRFSPGRAVLVVEKLVVDSGGARFEHDVTLEGASA